MNLTKRILSSLSSTTKILFILVPLYIVVAG